jgi:adenosylcobinamide-GDP ribazoletransferase
VVVVAAVVAGVILGPAGLLALALTAAAVLAIVFFLSRRLGGITGDVLGAGVETAELAALLTVAAWVHAAR